MKECTASAYLTFRCSLLKYATYPANFYASIRSEMDIVKIKDQYIRELRCPNILTLTSLWTITTDDKSMTFFLFSQKAGFDIACKLPPVEAICMKCQNPFSGESKKKKKKKKKINK